MVGLPELQEGVAHQVAVAVEHAADQGDVLARGAGLGHLVPDFLGTGGVAGGGQGQADVHVGAGSLRRGFRQQVEIHGRLLSHWFSKWVLRWPRRTMSKR
ncbi:hypothetical protein D3C86_1998960 [compost metagenome]